MLRLILQGSGYTFLLQCDTVWVMGLVWKTDDNAIYLVVLGLMKKSGLACEQTQQVMDAVLCCGAGMGTWVSRAPENGRSGVAEELLGVSQGLSSTAMPLRLFLIISRTGSQK